LGVFFGRLKQCAGRPNSAFNLPQRTAPLVRERIERADICQRRQFVTPQAGFLHDLLD